jgi:uncharacterized protein (UPF0335 family)
MQGGFESPRTPDDRPEVSGACGKISRAPTGGQLSRLVRPASALTARLPASRNLCLRIDEGESMTDTIGVASDRIRSFVERIEHLDVELQELLELKKQVFSEAKGEGLDVKILKEVIKLRKQDSDERDEHESLLDIYMRAMEQAPAPVAKAA